MMNSGMFQNLLLDRQSEKALYLPRVKRCVAPPGDDGSGTRVKRCVAPSGDDGSGEVGLETRAWGKDHREVRGVTSRGNEKRAATNSAQYGTSLISLSMVIHASWHHGSFVWHQDAAAWEQRSRALFFCCASAVLAVRRMEFNAAKLSVAVDWKCCSGGAKSPELSHFASAGPVECSALLFLAGLGETPSGMQGISG